MNKTKREVTAYNEGYKEAMAANAPRVNQLITQFEQLKKENARPERELVAIGQICQSCSALADAMAHMLTSYFDNKGRP